MPNNFDGNHNLYLGNVRDLLGPELDGSRKQLEDNFSRVVAGGSELPTAKINHSRIAS